MPLEVHLRNIQTEQLYLYIYSKIICSRTVLPSYNLFMSCNKSFVLYSDYLFVNIIAALKHCERHFKKKKEEEKKLLVISDKIM